MFLSPAFSLRWSARGRRPLHRCGRVELTGASSTYVNRGGARHALSLCACSDESVRRVEAELLPPERQRRKHITLGILLKQQNLAGTGGQAKFMIQSGEVLVNGQPETRRGRKIVAGDVVTVRGESYRIEVDDDDDDEEEEEEVPR
ncbi:hypothetical protein CDCA_CDCA01G0283 [Cyanidium caldarium]|uniref:RNA-binding S4 domain-containing protein n=1 Tax=Cyanidium caldarium TaxID=2771 RepID=A0AAV9IQM5_CYACA|nr:hypothetical protein CDCA_CDCA01G0283 [Cyanidium caldarium]